MSRRPSFLYRQSDVIPGREREVTDQIEDWPEASVRQREWVSIGEAVQRIREPELKALIAKAGI